MLPGRPDSTDTDRIMRYSSVTHFWSVPDHLDRADDNCFRNRFRQGNYSPFQRYVVYRRGKGCFTPSALHQMMTVVFGDDLRPMPIVNRSNGMKRILCLMPLP